MRNFCILFILLPGSLCATTMEWKGNGSDLKNPAHWSRAIPGADDRALFGNFPRASTTPTLQNALLTTRGFEFVEATSFHIQLSEKADLFFLDSGIHNKERGKQQITARENSGIYFRNRSSADLMHSGTVTLEAVGEGFIHFDDDSSASNALLIGREGTLIEFANNSQADEANIQLYQSALLFTDKSSGASARITAQEGNITFEEKAIAAFSHIELRHASVDFYQESSAQEALIEAYNSSKIHFHENSRAGEARIYAHNSKVFFMDKSHAEQAQIFLHAGAVLEIHQKNSIGSIMSDSSSQIKLLNILDIGSGNRNSSIEAKMQGSGGIIKTGTGKVHLSGANNYQGGTEIQEGILSGSALSLQGKINNNGTLLFQQKLREHFTGELSGKGTVEIAGSGIVHFVGDNSHFTGTTLLNGGGLYLSNMLGGDLFINKNGNFFASGPLQGSLTVNKEGRIYNISEKNLVRGDYLQNTDSYYRFHDNIPLQVAGSALLKGGAVEISNNLLPLKQALPILQAERGVTGHFDQIHAFNPLVLPTLSYDENHAFVTLYTQLKKGAIGSNQEHVAHQLDAIPNPSAEEGLLLASLISLPEEDLPVALEELSGLQYANLLQISALTNRSFLRRIYDPFRPNAMDCVDRSSGIIDTWISLELGHGFLREDANAQGFKMYHTALSFGAHGYLFPCLALGLAGNYGFDHLRFNVGGSGNCNSFEGAAYVMYQGNFGYCLGIGMVGYNHWNITQVLDFDIFDLSAKSTPGIFSSIVYGEVGLNVYLKYLLIQPFIGVEGGYYEQEKVKEKNGGVANLVIEGRELEDLEGRIGMHATTTFFCFTIAADLAWQYRFTTLGNRIQNRFASFGEAFEVRGPNQGHSTVEGALYLSMPFTESSQIYSRLSGEKSNRFLQCALTFGLQTSW